MDVQLHEFATRLTVTAREEESLTDVAARMRFHNVGSAVVVSRGNVVVGIITERDVVRAVADGADVEKTRVGPYMTANPTVIGPETEVKEAARIMLQSGCRHLPVVAPNGRLMGLASTRDLLFDMLWAPRCFETRVF